jgi:APA family basic amino acid/polyamine antiporter
VYFSLGVVAGHALGLTPIVFVLAAIFFVLTSMTYTEGASLHKERGGSTVFARHAFNELWSFVAGWAILLDYVILLAVTAFTATHYLAAFWGEFGKGAVGTVLAIAIVAFVAVINVRGVTARRYQRLAVIAFADVALQLLIIVVGLVLVFDPGRLTGPIHLGSAPSWSSFVFAATVATIACVGLEASSGLAGEVVIGRRGLRRLVAARSAAVLVVYVGISLVALTALPVQHGHTALGGRWLEAPVLGIVKAYPHAWLADTMGYLVGAIGALLLISAASGAMLGLSRLGYSLATNRQIPSGLGRLHASRSTPYVLIAIAAVLGAALTVPRDLSMLIGIYTFGALLAFTIAHLAVCVLRYREPQRDRPYRMPLSVRVRGGDLPVPAVLGALLSLAAWVAVLVYHDTARYVGLAWMAFGLVFYLVYRRFEGTSPVQRVTVPETALRAEVPEGEYGSILVPLFGTPLDDDIMQTAGRLAAEDHEDAGHVGATIEALWIFEVPMALPIDARLPEARLQQARAALERAKAVGEEYEGVTVATAKVRARRAGQAIVEEAKRRGVEVIVLAAEEPSRIRGGALLGGRGGPLDNYVGEVTRHVITKAPCRVILTAPPAERPSRAEEPAASTGERSGGVR